MKYIDVHINKLSIDGKGIGIYKNKPCYIIGALPNEYVRAEVIKEKKDYIEGLFLENLSQPSLLRITPKENHYLSTSYLQILDYPNQVKFKKKSIKKIFKKFGNVKIKKLFFTESPVIWGYRNKIEFCFTDENNDLQLAFHKRGFYNQKVLVLEGSKLAHPQINNVSYQILNILRDLKIKSNQLKTLVIKYSHHIDNTISLLLFKDKIDEEQFKDKFNELINTIKNSNINNILIGLSPNQNPRPTINNLIFQKGELTLTEKINHLLFDYSYNDFFQSNIFTFSMGLKDIEKFVDLNDKVLELYGGVGCIGISIASKAKFVTSIELIESSVQKAFKNAIQNNLSNYEAICAKSEDITEELLKDSDVVILDPPRNGLHKNLRKKILKTLPKRIIYLSCNPITQATDYNFLKESYQITYAHGYDFYPQTEHIETLLVLDRK